MFQWNPNAGGCLTVDSVVHGFTDYVPNKLSINDNIIRFRANPSFRRQGPWFDWAFIDWDDQGGLIPGRLLMFIDLHEAKIINDDEKETSYETSNTTSQQTIETSIPKCHYLTNGKFALIQSATASMIQHSDVDCNLTQYHYKSNMGNWLEMEQKYRLVPLESIDSPAYVIPTISFGNKLLSDKTAFVVKPMKNWGKLFMEQVDV